LSTVNMLVMKIKEEVSLWSLANANHFVIWCRESRNLFSSLVLYQVLVLVNEWEEREREPSRTPPPPPPASPHLSSSRTNIMMRRGLRESRRAKLIFLLIMSHQRILLWVINGRVNAAVSVPR
jgi:hypothetical protein